MRERLDQATRLLCGVMTKLSKQEPATLKRLLLSNPELHRWWELHQEEDRRREEQERAEREQEEARLSALKKLTPKERRALGL